MTIQRIFEPIDQLLEDNARHIKQLLRLIEDKDAEILDLKEKLKATERELEETICRVYHDTMTKYQRDDEPFIDEPLPF